MKREFYSQPTWNLIDQIYEAGQSPESWPTLLDGLFSSFLLNRSGALATEALLEFETELLPHFEKAIRLNRHIDREQQQDRSMEPALSAFAFALVVIDRNRHILYQNERFRISAPIPGIHQENHQLTIKDQQADATLDSLFESAESTNRIQPIQPIQFGDGTTATLLALPISSSDGTCSIALAMTDPNDPIVGGLGEQASAYGFTPAETDTLALLLAGQSAQEIAFVRGISENTTRTQIKSLMSKTATGSQADLIRTVLCGPILLERFVRPPPDRYVDATLDDARRNQHLTLEDGRSLGFAEYGPERGRPVLMMQNFNGSRRQLPVHESALVDQNVRLIIADRIGVGLSDPAQDYSMAASAEDAAQLLDALKIDQTHILGSSIGSAYALAFAHEFPDRVHRVALVGSMAELSPERALDDFEARTRKMFTLARWAPRALRFLLAIMRRETPEVMLEQVRTGQPLIDRLLYEDPAYHQMMLEVFMDTSRRDSGSLSFDINLMANPWPFKAEACTAPVDCWHGAKDPTFPIGHLLPFLERLPNCRSNILEEETHLLIYRHWHTIIASLFDPTEATGPSSIQPPITRQLDSSAEYGRPQT